MTSKTLKKYNANQLTDNQMRELGFTDYRKGYWYYCKNIDRDIIGREVFDTTFNLTINKKTSKCTIDILDESFLQPVEPNEQMKAKITEILNDLKQKGVLYLYE